MYRAISISKPYHAVIILFKCWALEQYLKNITAIMSVQNIFEKIKYKLKLHIKYWFFREYQIASNIWISERGNYIGVVHSMRVYVVQVRSSGPFFKEWFLFKPESRFRLGLTFDRVQSY